MSTSINTENRRKETNPQFPQSAQEGGLSFIKEKFWLYFLIFLGIYFLGKVVSESTSTALWTQAIRNIISISALLFLLVAGLVNAQLVYLVFILYIPFVDALPGQFGVQYRALNLFNLLFFVVLLAWVVDKFKKDRPFLVVNRETKLAVTFIIFSLISYIINGFEYGNSYLANNIFSLKRWIDPVLLFFITCGMAYRRDLRRDAIIALLLGVAMVIFLAIKDLGMISHFSDERRISGAGSQPNMLGAFVVDYMFIFLGILLVNFRKLIYWLASIPFWWGIRTVMFTFSRGAYAAFIVACLFISFVKNKILFVGCVAVFLFIATNLWILPTAVQERIEMTVMGEKLYSYGVEIDSSSAGRLEAWKYTLDLIKRKPFFGHGLGMVGSYLYYYAKIPIGDVHNSYLLIAAEQGLLTLFVFIASMFMGMRSAWFVYRNSKDDILKGAALGFCAGIIGLSVNCVFGSHMTTLWEITYFWILLALFATEERELRHDLLLAAKEA